MLSRRALTGARASRVGSRSSQRAQSKVAQMNARIATPLSSLYRHKLQYLMYTTERILELKTGKSSQKNLPTLYQPDRETENCGVGLVASLKSVPSRKVVEQADEMLVRMSHRGGCGCDPASGDGAGKLHGKL